jgi:hypothetical protein
LQILSGTHSEPSRAGLSRLASLRNPVPLISGISAAVHASQRPFGQIRTLELHISARIRQIDEMPVFPLRCKTAQNYAEIAQTREVPKSGSNPVRVAPPGGKSRRPLAGSSKLAGANPNIFFPFSKNPRATPANPGHSMRLAGSKCEVHRPKRHPVRRGEADIFGAIHLRFITSRGFERIV